VHLGPNIPDHRPSLNGEYHCELDFIERYWGAAKLRFRVAGRARTLQEMEKKMLDCLECREAYRDLTRDFVWMCRMGENWVSHMTPLVHVCPRLSPFAVRYARNNTFFIVLSSFS
jgi:hypothetical protein